MQKNYVTWKALAKLVVKKLIFLCSFLPIYIISLSVLFNCLKLELFKLLHNSFHNLGSKIKTTIAWFCLGHSASGFVYIYVSSDWWKKWYRKSLANKIMLYQRHFCMKITIINKNSYKIFFPFSKNKQDYSFSNKKDFCLLVIGNLALFQRYSQLLIFIPTYNLLQYISNYMQG